MEKMRADQAWAVAGWTFVYTLALFWLHRGLAFPFYLAGQDLHGIWILKAWLVGCMSDVWIAAFFSLLQVLLVSFLALFSLRLSYWAHKVLWGFFTLVVVFHQSYVEFFHAPLIPFHLSYLTDFDFIQANGRSVFAWRPALLLVVGVLGYWLAMRKKRVASQFFRIATIGAFFFAIGLHVLHIRYRIQWFVPESLQYNVYENLYARSLHAVKPLPLTAEEVALLEAKLGISFDQTRSELENLEKVLLRPMQQNLTVEGLRFVQEMDAMKKKGDTPLLLVLLLESFRAMDVGRSAPGAQSMTPQFDALTEKGIWFPNAWSTGTVTRGGQEAVWCGYWGGIYSSTMREVAWAKNFPAMCIPDLTPAIWLHGGEGHFDNQVAYWKRHGVSHVMDLHHFPASTPQTGWGVADRSFLQETVGELQQEVKKGGVRAGLLLSVTNHIPWEVPTDVLASIKQVQFPERHPSEKTVWYVDDAIGDWVRHLKEAHLWDSTLVVLVGDHGILAPSFYQAKSPNRFHQLGNVGFLLSGGIAERVASNPEVKKVQEGVVSQMDVAPFLALLLGKAGTPFMGETLFQQERRSVVMSHLMDEVYFPQYSVALPFRACAIPGWEGSEKFPHAYCRAMLRYIHVMRVVGGQSDPGASKQ